MLVTTRDRRDEPGIRPATMVAVEVMVLRPLDLAERTDAGPWPVLAIVVDEPNELTEPAVRPLFELMDDPARAHLIPVVAGHCRWSAIGQTGTLLKLAVRVTAPVRVDLDVVVPARLVSGFADLMAAGPTIAVTDRRHAGRLTRQRVPVRDALADLVLLSRSCSEPLACPPVAP